MQPGSIKGDFGPSYAAEKRRLSSSVSADRSNNHGKTLASFVVICEYVSFVTETVITARCVGTVLITSSVVLNTFVYICVTRPMHTYQSHSTAST